MLHDKNLWKLLEQTSVKDMRGVRDQHTIQIESDADLRHGFAALTKNKITAAPVFDKKSNKFIGIIDMKDFAEYILWLLGSTSENKLKHIPSTTMELANVCKENPFIPVSEDSSVGHLLKEFSSRGLHRMPVVSKGDPAHLQAMVSQSTIVQWLSENKKELGPYSTKSVMDLHVGGVGTTKGVVKVVKQTTVMEAFTDLKKYKIYGLAVVDDDGQLIGNISVSDLQYSIEEQLDNFAGTAEDFIKKELHQKPITCKPTDTLVEVIDLLAQAKLHRVYVVDSQNKPIGVITLTDIIDCILSIATGMDQSSIEAANKLFVQM